MQVKGVFLIMQQWRERQGEEMGSEKGIGCGMGAASYIQGGITSTETAVCGSFGTGEAVGTAPVKSAACAIETLGGREKGEGEVRAK